MASVYLSTCLVMFDPINPLQGVGLHHVIEKQLVGCRIPHNCWPQFLESVGDDILNNCSNDIKNYNEVKIKCNRFMSLKLTREYLFKI